MRLAEVMATLSLASDTAMGMPAEHCLRAAAVAVRLGEIANVTDAERADAFYLALMRYAGCTADAELAASVFGDESAMRGAMYGVDWGTPSELMPALWRAAGQGKGAILGAASAIAMIAKMPRLMNTATSHCEVGDRLALRFGFGAAFRAALVQSFERWDGTGYPKKRRGEAIATAMRLAHVGETIETAHRLGGIDGARATTKKRAKKELDPKLVELFHANADDLIAVLDVPSAWTAAMNAEPPAHREVDGDALDESLRAIGDFADMKSRFLRVHSSGVAALARRAATHVGMDDATAKTIERAAWLHDVGRVGVSTAVWDKPGPLTDLEWERVRAHTYAGERILARATDLASIASIATQAHERLDAGGYHRRLDAASCKAPARILAAADVYRAMTEERAHRRALSADQAASALVEMARSRALCPDAVAAVLAAAGHASPKRRARPAGLSDREVDVLRLVARGMTNKEIGTALSISTKTAGNHVQHIFEKVGVTTRAAATAFAMHEGLVD